MKSSDRIVIDPRIHHGKPVIRGTRIPVTTVVGSVAGGMTIEEIQRQYDLTADDIRAALQFASRAQRNQLSWPCLGVATTT